MSDQPVVAITGGSSQLGRCILQSLLFNGKFRPIVLSRESSNTPSWMKDLGVEVRRVDYLSEGSCAKALEGVHTVISTLLCTDGTWYRCQKNLLDAGVEKAGIRRFVPSEFGIGPKASETVELFAAEMLPLREDLRKAAQKYAGFEWTALNNGYFMNYLGYGCDKEGAFGLDHSFLFDVKNMITEIPVRQDGSLPDISTTTMADVGKYVAAMCELPLGDWDEDSYVAGETLNMGKIIETIECVRGSKMKITKHKKTAMTEQIDAISPDNEEGFRSRFFLQLARAFAEGEKGWTVMEPKVNRKFPHIKTTSVDEYVGKYWGEN